METQLKQSQHFINTSWIFRSSNFADGQFWFRLKGITEAASCYLLQESLRSITETWWLLHQSRVRAVVYSDKSRQCVEWQDRSRIWEGRYATTKPAFGKARQISFVLWFDTSQSQSISTSCLLSSSCCVCIHATVSQKKKSTGLSCWNVGVVIVRLS